jgi:hypothetical protein
MTNGIGAYIIVEDDLDNAALDRAVLHVQRTQPRDVIVSTGGQVDRAMQTCERLRALAPETRITYRKWPNDGAIKLFGHNGASLYNTRVLPVLDWLKKHKIAYHLDNESVENDMTAYGEATAQAITMADADGVALAVGSFATGNPAERHYAQLDPMWRALAKSERSFWAPHEYFNTTPSSSGGHIFRFMEAWKRCDQIGIKRPATVIQEFGLLAGYDPEAGYRRIGWGGERYGDSLIDYFERWYRPHGVSVCPYAFCGTHPQNSKWRDCSTNDEGYLTTIEAYHPASVVIEPPKPEPPKEPPKEPETPPQPEMTPLMALKLVNETVREMRDSLDTIYKLNKLVIEKIENGI